jgi:hypothetical protein
MMWPRPRQPGKRPEPVEIDPSVIEQSLADDLLDASAVPDLTKSIMGRLGYMKVSPKIARRHRLRRWLNRLGTAVVLACAIGIGFQFYSVSEQIRRPAGPTIPDALGNDLQRQQQRLNNAIHTIRNLSPGIPSSPLKAPRKAQPQPLQDDVNTVSALPIRWV